MVDFSKLEVSAEWTNDCQGKKDYDGPLLSISSRYWPGPAGGGSLLVVVGEGGPAFTTIPYGARPSAMSSVVVNLAHGQRLTWSTKEFEADTEEEVKKLVEAWAKAELLSIASILALHQPFKEG